MARKIKTKHKRHMLFERIVFAYDTVLQTIVKQESNYNKLKKVTIQQKKN